FFFFFFQAEDRIRDGHVTGVQTCALPICGGSIAWIDAGRSLRVGPGSAGADPGPIAYGKGGESVTVTDADLSAGVLGPTLLGGRLPLHADLAAKGIARLADSVHLSSEETVLGVQRVVRATMAKAM